MANIIKVHDSLMSNELLKKRFEDVLGENAGSYMTSVLNIVKANGDLQECEAASVWNAALCSAAMHLPLDAGLGYAYVVPYKDNKNKVTLAQFQLGAKGYKQLAMRTGEYVAMNSTDVREGEIKKRNRLTGQIEFSWIEDDAVRQSTPTIGYVHYFELTNGFSSTLYMSMEELMEHARKYSKMYQNDLKYGTHKSKWSIEEERGAMCEKTVAKLNLSKNGVLSIEMQRAVRCDNAVINENGEPDYIDGVAEEPAQQLETKTKAQQVTEEFSDVFNKAEETNGGEQEKEANSETRETEASADVQTDA